MISVPSLAHPPTRIAFLGFFLSHIPITIFLDAQAAASSFLSSAPWPFFPIPAGAVQVRKWYAETFRDHMMLMVDDAGAPAPAPSWFRVLIWGEVLFQLPFFFVAVAVLWQCGKRERREPPWFRSTCMIYGVHVSTTLMPCLAEIFDPPSVVVPIPSWSERAVLAAFYLPYLFFPAYLVVIAMCHERGMFSENNDKKDKSS